MPENNLPKRTLTKILLATDLSSRGDRALDRAAQLAAQWGAQLHIVHAIDRRTVTFSEAADILPSWRRSPDPAVAIRNQIRRDLREEVNQLKIHVEEGDPYQVILKIAAKEGCELIIVGLARDDFFGRMLLGSTVENLVRKSPISVLVVKSRPRGPYQHVLVGTDFTEESRYGLEVAASSFPACQFTVMHAFEMPYKAFLTDTPLSRDFAAVERKAIEDFVKDSSLSDETRRRIRLLTEHGPADLMLCRFVEEKDADLTVIGAYGRGFLFHLLVGGNTPRIVDSVPGDILLVRAHHADATPPPAE